MRLFFVGQQKDAISHLVFIDAKVEIGSVVKLPSRCIMAKSTVRSSSKLIGIGELCG